MNDFCKGFYFIVKTRRSIPPSHWLSAFFKTESNLPGACAKQTLQTNMQAQFFLQLQKACFTAVIVIYEWRNDSKNRRHSEFQIVVAPHWIMQSSSRSRQLCTETCISKKLHNYGKLDLRRSVWYMIQGLIRRNEETKKLRLRNQQFMLSRWFQDDYFAQTHANLTIFAYTNSLN